MAAAEIMNLHTNFFDEVYESNFMMKGKKSEENENIETKNVNSTLFTSKVNNTFVDKSKLLRISSVDSSEDQIVSSSDFESGSSPLTDTTNEDDVDWDYLSEEDENDDVDWDYNNDNNKSQKNILSLDSDEDDEDDDMSNTIFSNKLLQPRQSSMICTSSDNNHTVQNIRNENKNTIAAAVTTTTTTTSANTTNNSNVNNQTTWNPFGIPIPPALVWFTVMKQQINQLPITRQDVTVTHSNHDHQHVDDDATSIQTLSNSGNISITTNNNIETTLSPPLNNNNNNVVMKKKKNRKPFTKEERKQRNREAAAESRMKKKQQLADLNNEILRLKNLVLHKDKHIEKLTNENLMLKSQLGLKTNNNNNNNSNDDDATQQQPPRKRKRIITNNNNNMIKNSLKIGVACSMAMCLFTEDGTTTAFVFDHVSHVHNNILLMKFTNWFFTLTIFTMFLFSYIVINFELKKCKEKTTKFLLPLFTTSNTTSKTRSKTSCSNNNNYNERKGVRIRRDEEDNKVFTYGNRRF